MNNTPSPFLYPQQVPGTPLYVSKRPSTICSPSSCVPDIDDLRNTSFISCGRPTPKSAPSTPGMTVPSSIPSPALYIGRSKERQRSARTHKKDSNGQAIKSTTPKLEQIVPSCSPLTAAIIEHAHSNDAHKKELESTKQISLFSGDDEIFA